MFTYPFEDNVIKVFFQLAAEMLSATSLTDLTPYPARIKTYKDAYQAYQHHFAFDNPAAAEDKPTVQQRELHQSELDLIDALTMIHDYKVADIQGEDAVPTAQFTEIRQRLMYVETTNRMLTHPLAVILNRYICIVAQALDGRDGLSLVSIDMVAAFINAGAKLVDIICSFEYDPVVLDGLVVSNVPAELLVQLTKGIAVATMDRDEQLSDTAVEKTVFKLVNRAFVYNLIGARMRLEYHAEGDEQLTWREEFTSGYVNDKQKIFNLMSQIDAVAKLSNLAGFLDYRELYTSHFNRYKLQQENKLASRYYHQDRFPVLSSFINTSKLDHNIDIATGLLFRHIEIAESLFHVLVLLEDSGLSIKDLKLFLFNFIDNINFDTRLLIPLTAVCEKRYPASQYEPDVKMLYLKNALRMSSTLLYMLDPQRGEGIKPTICTAEAAITCLGGFGNSNIASLYAFTLQTKYMILLNDSTTAEERIAVLNRFADEIRTLFLRYQTPGEINDELTDIQLAAQFILDVFLYGVFLCKDSAEIQTLLQPDIDKNIKLALTKVHPDNHRAYVYLTRILVEIKKPEVMQRATRNNDVSALDEKLKIQLNSLAINGMNGLYSDEIIADFHEFANRHARMSSNTDVLFVRFIGNVAVQLSKNADPEIRKNAFLVQVKVSKYADVMIESAKKTLDKLSFEKSSYKPAGFVREVKVHDFLPTNLKATAVSAAQKKKKNTAKQKKDTKQTQKQTVATTLRTKPEINSDFKQVEKYFGDTKPELIAFYRNALDTHKPELKIHALAGCARCLVYFADKEKEIAFAMLIESHMKSLFVRTKSYPLTKVTKALEAEIKAIMAAWHVANPPLLKPKLEPAGLPALPRPIKPNILYSACSMTLFSETVHRSSPQVKTEIPDTYTEMRVHYPLDLEEIPAQKKVLSLLDHAGMEPIVHGGRIFDKLFGVKVGDLDALCISHDVLSVALLLKRHKTELDIAEIRKTVNEDVLIITFNELAIKDQIKRKSDLRLELYVISSTIAKSADVIKLARRFGTTFIGYDMKRQDIVDPLKLFAKLLESPPQLDVQKLGVDIETYLQKQPVRILDNLKRIVRCRSAGKVLTMSNILAEAFHHHKCKLANPPEKFSIEKFNRLFMQGYATIFYHLLVEYDCLRYLFPMFEELEYGSLLFACQQADATLLPLNIDMLSDRELEVIRADFYATAFYLPFLRTNAVINFKDNQERFYQKSNSFLGSLPFQTQYADCGGLVNLIQDRWWNQICEMFPKSGKLLCK